jgi:hypothetical protein
VILGSLEFINSRRGVISVLARSDDETPDVRVRLRPHPLRRLVFCTIGGVLWGGCVLFMITLFVSFFRYCAGGSQ